MYGLYKNVIFIILSKNLEYLNVLKLFAEIAYGRLENKFK